MSDQTTLPAKRQDFPAMLQQFKSEIARALPKHLNPDRMARIALTEFRKNPKLGQCDPRSVFAAVIMASQTGLEPGLMGQAYLIPYGSECQFIPGYQGLIELVRRGGQVKRIEAHVVHEKDRFVYRTGLTTTLEHEPFVEGDPGAAKLVYSVAEFADGGYHVEVMTKAQVEAIRRRSRAASNGPWVTDTEEMWRKTAIRRICKFLPKSAELAMALAADSAAAMGTPQKADPLDVIEGTWAPPEESVEQQQTQQAPDPAATAREKAQEAVRRGPGRPKKEAAPAPSAPEVQDFKTDLLALAAELKIAEVEVREIAAELQPPLDVDALTEAGCVALMAEVRAVARSRQETETDRLM